MTAIPADIHKAAAAVYAQLGRGSIADEQAIAKALMLERERVAVVIREARSIVADVRAMASPAIAERLSIDRLDVALSAISPQPSPTAGASR